MQKYITEKSEYWSLFNYLIESIPRLINPLFFSLLQGNHLPPYMLNLAYREKLGTKFIYQLIPISLDSEGCE
jgi:hypothetical protein